ncbi:hypothetical protein KY290_036018 [Solanum tuberosum]|uniref:Uncharacterized protein n=1 Tax=Solanum tuberosum TaxID=4113 RepID=A0ABQ7TTG3_SOLTU|nr:hypothetical protein KY289_035522 [Solanum tuberosum]KAH0737313.1 hypothetical protein KY290_036018 [Solanum tuberosum]
MVPGFELVSLQFGFCGKSDWNSIHYLIELFQLGLSEITSLPPKVGIRSAHTLPSPVPHLWDYTRSFEINFTPCDLGDKSSTDWDKAWSSFRKRSRKNIFSNIFSQFSPNKYVTWNPKRSEYPLSEEVDPIKRAEKSNLMLWTSPQFTLVGAIVIVTFLLVYSILAITK